MARQLLLRVPEDLHARLAELARREGRSINSVANELLDIRADVAAPATRQTLRARARALGVLGEASPAPPVSGEQRARAIASRRGQGAILDQLLADGR